MYENSMKIFLLKSEGF